MHFSLLPVTTPFCSGTGISFPSLLCAGLSLWSSRSTCPAKPCSTWRPTTARSGRCLWRPGTGRAHPSTCRTMESGLLMSGTMSSKSTEPCLLCWQSLSPELSVCDFPVPKGIDIRSFVMPHVFPEEAFSSLCLTGVFFTFIVLLHVVKGEDEKQLEGREAERKAAQRE